MLYIFLGLKCKEEYEFVSFTSIVQIPYPLPPKRTPGRNNSKVPNFGFTTLFFFTLRYIQLIKMYEKAITNGMTKTINPVRLYSVPIAMTTAPSTLSTESYSGGLLAIAINVTQNAKMEQKKSQN
jgi:hypothetical protein